MKIEIDVLQQPIERIKQVCSFMGVEEEFDRALSELETYLEGEVASGETREAVLTDDGFRFLQRKLDIAFLNL
jgi:hypothetical protein